jgi:ribosome-binding protein aMBF1 (putative translation factor)
LTRLNKTSRSRKRVTREEQKQSELLQTLFSADEPIAVLVPFEVFTKLRNQIESAVEDYLDAKAIEEANQTPQEDYEVVNPTHVKIKQARLAAGLTQRQLAEKMGVKQPFIARLERPDAYPTVRTLQKIAKALGLKDYRKLVL